MTPFPIIATTNINLRQGPSESFEVVEKVPYGYTMKALNMRKDGGGVAWYQTDVNDAWVKSTYVAQPNEINMQPLRRTAQSKIKNVHAEGDAITTKTSNSGKSPFMQMANSVAKAANINLGVLGSLVGINQNGSQDTILKRRIYATPYQFLETADTRPSDGPLGLAFVQNIMCETPILSILPGIPNPLAEMNTKKKTQIVSKLVDTINKDVSLLKDHEGGLLSEDSADMKFFDFEPRCADYFLYVNVLCRMAAVFMGIANRPVPGGAPLGDGRSNPIINATTKTKGGSIYGEYNWFYYHLSNVYNEQNIDPTDVIEFGYDAIKEGFNKIKDKITDRVKGMVTSLGDMLKGKESNSGQAAVDKTPEGSGTGGGTNGIMNTEAGNYFYMDEYFINFFVKPPSYSESFSNTTDRSAFANAIQGMSSTMKEFMFLFSGLGVNTKLMTENAESVAKSMETAVKSVLDNAGMKKALSSFFTGAASVVTGANLIFPEIWETSSYNRDFNIDIQLTSPYGDKESIYLNIVVPLMHLLALTLPRQATVNSYTSPFLVRCSLPGYFSCDMGIVKELSISKGGSDGSSWSVDGFPTEVNVSMSISDLYNALSMSNVHTARNAWNFLYNGPLMDYVGVLCGLNMRTSEYGKKIQLIKFLLGNAALDHYDYTMNRGREWSAQSKIKMMAGKG